VNRSLSGWANYFHYRNSNQAMEKVKTHAEQRVRAHLMKRHKVKVRGIGEGRFPIVNLYWRYGLNKVLTVADWRSTRAWPEEQRRAVCGNRGKQGFCEVKTRQTACAV
jgi:RNA-directed DNA polymerase